MWNIFARVLLLVTALSLSCFPSLAVGQQGPPSDSVPEPSLAPGDFPSAIQAMKANPRGPFAGISWFCNDGTVHPARPYPCEERGDGVQHGRLGQNALDIRAGGYLVANVLAAVDTETLLAAPDAEWRIKQLVLEKYLVQADDGWIFRKAQYYRGAFQIEDEDASGRAILLGLLQKDSWLGPDFAVLREAVRLLPHGEESPPVTRARQFSKELNDKDAGFRDLRIKLHNVPEPGDAELVRAYARDKAPEEMVEEYQQLAGLLDDIHFNRDLQAEVRAIATASTDKELAKYLRAKAAALDKDNAPLIRFKAACNVLGALRSRLTSLPTPETRLQALDTGLAVETLALNQGVALSKELQSGAVILRRGHLLTLVEDAANGLYGLGLLSERERQAVRRAVLKLNANPVTLAAYEFELGQLERLPEWCERTLRYHFGSAVEHLAFLEPKTRTYFQDRMRSSHLLPVAELLAVLGADAARLSGVRHTIFGHRVDVGLTPLNPGLARGPLYVHDTEPQRVDPDGIHVLPETVEDLPAVAGILTAGRGNLLSHVQLLARNLGVPNVAVAPDILDSLRSRAGRTVVLAASPGGKVLRADDDPAIAAALAKEEAGAPADFLIPADKGKLDLKVAGVLDLAALRAEDSGRVCGPKAANLGELKAAFPEAVTEGLILPFGIFAKVLERPGPEGSPMNLWLKQQYKRLRAMPNGPAKAEAAAGFLARVREWIAAQPLDPALVAEIKAAMAKRFGPDGSYGVFVRSDTNVEDLPGFTGAGLNKTVANVAGQDAILEGVKQVWASPFTERAYGWRQAHMEKPEELYVSTLIMKSVAVDKSGVLVTADLATGARDKLTVAVNFGVGGAVAGQSAEELLIDTATGEARLLAEAAQPVKRVLKASGGLEKLPAPKAGVLTNRELPQLLRLAQQAPKRFERLRGEDGQALPADIEFGFKDGELVLFQIRPLQGSVRARTSAYLRGMDADLADASAVLVDLNQPPLKPAMEN